MKLFVKNMVCGRCIMMVRTELEKSGFEPVSVELGEVELADHISSEEKEDLNERLESLGFVIIDDKKTRTIENIKTAVIEYIHHTAAPRKLSFSEYFSERIPHDYSYLSKLFSEVQGVTLEQYVITQKIEKVKELLVYDELSLSQIALQLNYSSVSHLSKQFKKITGFTPTHFRQVKENKRIPLDKI